MFMNILIRLCIFSRNYHNIDSVETRRRYKADFYKQYQEYLRLHKFIEEHMKQFTELEERLKNETQGSEEYNVSVHLLLMNFS